MPSPPSRIPDAAQRTDPSSLVSAESLGSCVLGNELVKLQEQWPKRLEAEVSRQFVEELLTSFLSNAAGLDLREPIERVETLPTACRRMIEFPSSEKRIWVAWITAVGVVVATGCYDHDRSRQIGTHVLLIEWWIPPDTHHVSWWRADPDRPGEWTAGRGQS